MTRHVDPEIRRDLVALLHAVHTAIWSGRAHECRADGCSGDTGDPPRQDANVWGPGGPPSPWHSRDGRMVELPPILPPTLGRTDGPLQ